MKNQNFLLKIILVVLCLHLLYTNADILLNTQANANMFQKILLGIFGLSYSLLTTIAIYKMDKIAPIIVFSMMDGFAVFMRIEDMRTAIFYGLYTAIIVIVAFVIKQNDNKKNQKIIEDNQNEIELNRIRIELNRNEIEINRLNNEISRNEIKLKEYENEIIKSLVNSLTKITDPEKIKEKIFANKLLSEEVKNEILSKKIEKLSNYEQPILDIQ